MLLSMTKDGRIGPEECRSCLKVASSNIFAITWHIVIMLFYELLLVNPSFNSQLLSLQSIVCNQAFSVLSQQIILKHTDVIRKINSCIMGIKNARSCM